VKDAVTFKAFRNNTRSKVYLGISILVPVKTGGKWHGFSEPSNPEYRRIPIRPFRYEPVPMVIPGNTATVVAWGIFERRVGGEPTWVEIRPGYAAPVTFDSKLTTDGV